MSKKKFQHYLPDPERLKANKSLRFLGDHLFHTSLWHMNSRSVAKACMVGIFAAFIPIPFQMVLAALLAVYLRCNVPISVALVWITNPLTMPFVFYFTYKVGCLILNVPPGAHSFTLSWEWFVSKLPGIWLPLYLGSFVSAIVSAPIVYFSVRILWRLHIIRKWHRRHKVRKLNSPPS